MDEVIQAPSGRTTICARPSVSAQHATSTKGNTQEVRQSDAGAMLGLGWSHRSEEEEETLPNPLNAAAGRQGALQHRSNRALHVLACASIATLSFITTAKIRYIRQSCFTSPSGSV